MRLDEPENGWASAQAFFREGLGDKLGKSLSAFQLHHHKNRCLVNTCLSSEDALSTAAARSYARESAGWSARQFTHVIPSLISICSSPRTSVLPRADRQMYMSVTLGFASLTTTFDTSTNLSAPLPKKLASRT
jgi:hypothetical protein